MDAARDVEIPPGLRRAGIAGRADRRLRRAGVDHGGRQERVPHADLALLAAGDFLGSVLQPAPLVARRQVARAPVEAKRQEREHLAPAHGRRRSLAVDRRAGRRAAVRLVTGRQMDRVRGARAAARRPGEAGAGEGRREGGRRGGPPGTAVSHLGAGRGRGHSRRTAAADAVALGRGAAGSQRRGRARLVARREDDRLFAHGPSRRQRVAQLRHLARRRRHGRRAPPRRDRRRRDRAALFARRGVDRLRRERRPARAGRTSGASAWRRPAAAPRARFRRRSTRRPIWRDGRPTAGRCTSPKPAASTTSSTRRT